MRLIHGHNRPKRISVQNMNRGQLLGCINHLQNLLRISQKTVQRLKHERERGNGQDFETATRALVRK